MGKEVDQQVVQMQFNNAQFKAKARETISILDRLKTSLNFDKSKKQVDALSRASKNFDMSHMSKNVDNIASKFTIMGRAGVTAIDNISNRVINAGVNLGKSLTVEPIMTGLDEYETKINAIQTILTNTKSKGTTLDDVTKSLDDLNTYADKTIYNFAEMTRNIGTFTAAGINLKDSATAIKGIANLAAGSGSSAQQASTAMYQLSQALAAGSVKLMDWNSVVNAGMGGELFQKELKKTARAMGWWIDETAPFRETLQDGWVTSDVLIKTLESFANNQDLVDAATKIKTMTQLIDTMKESVQSGWAKSWEYIIGDKAQATSVLTAISQGFENIVGPSAEARNNVLKFWNQTMGRDEVIKGLSNIFESLMNVAKPLKEAFTDIFPPMTGAQLVELSKKFRQLTETFKISEETGEKLHTIFKGIFSIFGIGAKAVSAAATGLNKLVSLAPDLNLNILDIIESWGQWLINLNDGISSIGIFNTVMAGINKTIEFFAWLIDSQTDNLDKFKSSLVNTTNAIKGKMEVATNSMRESFNSFIESSQESMAAFKNDSKSKIDAFGDRFNDKFEGIRIAAGKVGGWFKKMYKSIVSGIKSVTYEDVVRTVSTGMLAGVAIGIMKFVKTLRNIAEGGKSIVDGVVGVLEGVQGALEGYQSSLKADALMKIAGAIGLLTISLLVLSTIPVDKILPALAAMSVLLAEVFVGLTVLNKANNTTTGMFKMAASLTAIGLGMLILVGAMKVMANMDYEEINKGLVAVGMLLAEIGLFLKVGKFQQLGITTGIAIIAIASAIKKLANVVTVLGQQDFKVIAKGLFAIGVLLLEISVFSKMIEKTKGLAGIDMLILAGSLLVLGKAIERIGSLDLHVIQKGLLGIAGGMLVLVGALKVMPKGSMFKALGITIIAGSLFILANAIERLAAIPTDSIYKGVATLAATLGILVIGLRLMKGAIVSAVALVIVANGLIILAGAMKLFEHISWEGIGKGLAAFGGVLAVLALAGLLLVPVVPVLAALGAAVILLGVGFYAAGAGAALFAAAMAALAVSGVAGGAVLVKMVADLLGLIPMLAKNIGLGFIEILKVIRDSAPVFKEAFVALIVMLCEGANETIPLVLDAFLNLLDQLFKTLAEHTPNLIQHGAEFILALLKGYTKYIPEIVKAGVKAVLAFVKGIEEALPEIVDQAATLAIEFINSLGNTIENRGPEFFDAVKNLFIGMINAALSILTGNKVDIRDAVDGLIQSMRDAIVNGKQVVIDKFDEIVEGVKTTITDKVEDFKQAGSWVIEGLIDGISGGITSVADAIGDVGQAMIDRTKKILGIHSPSRVYAYFGKMVGDGMANGVASKKKKVVKTTEQLAKESYQKSKDYIDKRKYYNQLSLMEELKEWEKVQSRYQEGTKQREDADKEVYRVKKELTDKMKAIDDEYARNVEETNRKLREDAQKLGKEYDDALKQRSDAIYGAYSLFEKMEKPEAVSGKELIQNLKAQVIAIAEWRDNINELERRGITGKMLEELRNFGPKSAAQIKALTKLSKPELERYAMLWESKHSQANEQAEYELKDMAKNIAIQIDAMRVEADKKLDGYKDIWSKKMAELSADTSQSAKDMVSGWNTQIDELSTHTTGKFTELSTEVKQMDWNGIGKHMVTGITSGVDENADKLIIRMRELARSAITAAEEVLDINSPSREFARIGRFCGLGLIRGVDSTKRNVVNSMKRLGSDTISAIQDSMDDITDLSQPTIRPVVDLSDAKNGLGGLASLFNTIALPVRAAINSVSSTTRTSKATNDENTQNGRSLSITNEFTGPMYIREEADIKKVARELYQLQLAGSRG